MCRQIIFILSLFLLPNSILAQTDADTNYVDKKGLKQGYWLKKSEEGTVVYEGKFKDDKPVGTFLRYYPDGSLQAEILYGQNRNSRAKIYYPETGGLMAEGKYLDQKRDSVWHFYDADSVLTSKETYSEGLKNGLSILYYASGAIAEKMTYQDDVQNGLWEQFYESGLPKLKATVVDGTSYDGEFISYYDDGKPLLKGKYQDGKKESSWYEFNKDGSIKVINVYRGGNVVNEYPKNGVFEYYYPDDIKKAEYTYKDGEKHGPFKEYFHQGEWKTETVSDELGADRKVQRLFGTQIEREGKYFEGKLNGEIIYYNPKGKIERKELYEKGELQN